jgi:lysophospholipase L1-like esterase
VTRTPDRPGRRRATAARLRVLAAALLAAAAAVCASAGAAPADSSGWSATWSAAQNTSQSEGFGAETVRMVVNTSLGGSHVRIRLSNLFALGTVSFGHVTIGLQQSGSTTVGTPTNVTFGGSGSVTMAPGASVLSDAAALAVPAHTRLLVSLYFPAGSASISAPMHSLGDNVEYNNYGPDIAAAQTFTTSNTFNYTMYVQDIEVATAAPATVVAVGDSITDGANLASGSDTRWTDYLNARISPLGLAVANEGINGDEVTSDNPGLPGIANRWLRDVLSVPGARTVIEQGGINDLRLGVSAAALESAQTTLIEQAHAAGLKVLLTTITPCSGASSCSAAFETARQAYNTWVRAGVGAADGYVDFDHAIGNGASIATAYDSGDHLHPNAAGCAVMADAVNTSLL